MLKRVSAPCALGLALGAVLLQAQDVFVLPGAGATSGSVAAFTASPLSRITTFNAGNGTFQVLPTVDASKFYLIASSVTQTITATDATFLNPAVVANLPLPATSAVMTPDGRLLAVAAGTLHLYDTTSDAEVISGGISQGNGIDTFEVATSLDSSTLFALGAAGNGTSQLAAISTLTRSVSTTLAFPQAATAVSVGPNGLVYVSLPDEILELDPRTLQTTAGGTMGLTGTPGALVFTPDGQYALAANHSPLASGTLVVVSLATHTVTVPNLGLPALTGFQILGTDSFLASSSGGLYQIALSTPISVTQQSISGASGTIVALTASNEVPAGAIAKVHSLYAVTGTNIYQINTNSFSIITQYPLPNSTSAGGVSFEAPVAASQSRPASLLPYGTSQVMVPGASSEPLVVQVLDTNNHPVMGVPVQFQSSSNFATLSSSTVTTQANGYALTYIKAPSVAGPISVTASVGLLAVNFNINVSTTAGNANNPRLSIVSGQGNLMQSNTSTAVSFQYGSPLKVLVTDSNGNPLPDVPITFSVPSAGGTIIVNGMGGSTETINSASNGTAQVDFLTTSLSPNNTTGFAQTSVTVTAPGTNSVVFYVTTVSQSPGATVQFLAPTPGTVLTGPEGGVLTGAVTAEVTSSAGYGIPNVSLILSDGNLDPTLYPTATCNTPNGSAILTTTNGAVSCDVVLGPRIGSGTFTASIGYTKNEGPYQFQVTPAAPAVVQIKQGNNQVGNPGQKLPLSLLVHITDSGGNLVTGTAVTWQVLTAGAVTLSSISSTTDSNGNASAVATLGSTGGVAQVKVTAGNASATFNLTINVPSVGLQKISGDQQTTAVNTAFSLPLTVKVVDSSSNGVPGVQVNFQVTSGDATLGTSSATTDSTGQASTTVTAGATGGSITVTATSGGFNVTFALTAQLPGPSHITIVNGASFNANTGISPGGIATIRGMGILPGVEGLIPAYNIVGPLPTTFQGVTITFNGTPAPIYYVESNNGVDQVTVQVPFEVQPGTAVALEVSVTDGGSATVMVPVKVLAPGVFTTVYNGATYAVAIRPDGSPVSPTNPAQQGENISVYVTGLGPVTPATATGDVGIPGQSLIPNAKGKLPLVVGLNKGGVPLVSADYAPGLVGVYVITLQVPTNTQTGPSQPIGIFAVDSSGKLYSAQPTYIPIQ